MRNALTKLKIATALLLAASCAAGTGTILLSPEARAIAHANGKQGGNARRPANQRGRKPQATRWCRATTFGESGAAKSMASRSIQQSAASRRVGSIGNMTYSTPA